MESEQAPKNKAIELMAATECNGCSWLNVCSQETECLSCREQFNKSRAAKEKKKCPIPRTLINFYCKHPNFMAIDGCRGRFMASFGIYRTLKDAWPERPEFCPQKNKKANTDKGDANA